jgi:8-oxo-dGTP pyrophosphatase MutT (NUDIX family)
MLVRYAEAYPQERHVAQQIADLVEQHADCCHRACRPGHLTGSAWVVSRDRQRVALVHHRKLGRWLQPGGHADGDLDIAGVAWREAREELGLAGLQLVPDDRAIPLDIDVHVIPARYDAQGHLVDDAHEHHDLRFLFIATDEQLVVSDESHDVRWFAIDELHHTTDEPSVLRLRDKCRALWD